jgi:hypothetical protein
MGGHPRPRHTSTVTCDMQPRLQEQRAAHTHSNTHIRACYEVTTRQEASQCFLLAQLPKHNSLHDNLSGRSWPVQDASVTT